MFGSRSAKGSFVGVEIVLLLAGTGLTFHRRGKQILAARAPWMTPRFVKRVVLLAAAALALQLGYAGWGWLS